ncbi:MULTISPECIES: DUF1294 domain-containing protein [Mameliella]|uniref:DUF1294 domain-containing protein n=1 Tax=Mameliella TaxID=1434019 RepID=UPI0017ABE4A3|nr:MULTISPECIES: DUF1294 domain-containing protein [Mameliella]MCR9274356.1 DUF1294 domain-containing protein [Paracoccaceae bacterium]
MNLDAMAGAMGSVRGLAGPFLLLNLLAFCLFGLDKTRARRGRWRLSERTLLTFAAVGGSIGAKIGQRVFRHKTTKQPFAFVLNVICMLHMALAVLLAMPSSRSWLQAALTG